MNKDQRKKKIAAIKIENSEETRTMPLAVGDVLVFNGAAENFVKEEPKDEVRGIGAWTRINAEDGSISATQLLRKGNGITLKTEGNTNRIHELIENYADDDMVFSIFIKDEKIRNTSTGERRYYKLKVAKGRAESPEDFN